jgi:hypothetical protein
MSIFREIKVFFVLNNVIKDLIKGASQMNGITPGYKTSEFWLHLVTQATVLWGAVSGFVPPKYAVIVSAAGTAICTICRTAYKAYSEIKAATTTTAPDVTVTTSVTPQ